MVVSVGDFNLCIKKQYCTEMDKSQYYLKLCCPVIVNLKNDCPQKMVCFKIKSCFYFESTIFELGDEDIIFAYNNLTNEIKKKAKIIRNNSGTFICILTDDVKLCNELCITDVCIPVVPKCYSKKILNKLTLFSKIGSWVCVGLFIKENLLKAINIFTKNNNNLNDPIEKEIWTDFINHINNIEICNLIPDDCLKNDYYTICDIIDYLCELLSYDDQVVLDNILVKHNIMFAYD